VEEVVIPVVWHGTDWVTTYTYVQIKPSDTENIQTKRHSEESERVDIQDYDTVSMIANSSRFKAV
jgi:hypothetical protein